MKTERMKYDLKATKASEIIEKMKLLPDPKVIWKGIPEGSKGLLTGVAKTGKTTFAEDLAICMSIGRNEFFGFDLDPTPRKVLFINLEEKPAFWGKRQAKQLGRLTKEEITLFEKNYFSAPMEFIDFINGEEDWLTISNYIKEVDPDVLLIDSLSHLCVGEIERSVVAQSFVQNFRKYIGTLNKTVIVIHHNTKGNNSPVEMEKIAGSRFIAQEFEYAYGFANIPGSDDESYVSMVYNKHFPRESATSYKYKFSNDGWVENVGVANKYELYGSNHTDFRFKTENKDKIQKYFISQSSQDGTGSQTCTLTASELQEYFVDTKAMSKDTLFKNMKALVNEDKIKKPAAGVYVYEMKNENENKNGEQRLFNL